MASQLEIEQKYDAGADFALPDLGELPGCVAVSEPETYLLSATYFDTSDFRLVRHGITLRRRRGGHDAGWHLKLPVGPDTKREVHEPLGPDARTVPERLANLVAARTRGNPLNAVARLETRRTCVRLLGEGGEALAEVADDGVSGEVMNEVADETAVSAWREIEIELGSGPPELLKAARKRLLKAGARPAEAGSKLERLLADHLPATAPTTGKAGTAGEVAMSYLAAQVKTLLAYDPQVRLREHDSVHKMRVAVRRTRSIFKSYRRVLNWESLAPLHAELTWLAEQLGEVRDLEVLRERFTARVHDLPAELAAGRGWLDDLVTQEQDAWRRVHATLRDPRYFAILDSLDRLVADPPPTSPSSSPLTDRAGLDPHKIVTDIVMREWRRLEKALTAIEAQTTEEEREAARHEARKAAKRTRYTAEAAASVLGDPAAKTGAKAHRLQDVLGRYQDAVIAQRYLVGIAAGATGADLLTIGVLIGLERSAAAAEVA